MILSNTRLYLIYEIENHVHEVNQHIHFNVFLHLLLFTYLCFDLIGYICQRRPRIFSECLQANTKLVKKVFVVELLSIVAPFLISLPSPTVVAIGSNGVVYVARDEMWFPSVQFARQLEVYWKMFSQVRIETS